MSDGGRTAAGGALILLATALMLAQVMADYDAFYHLAIGREVWQSLQVPAVEFFLWPKMGQPARFHEWGFGAWLYGGWQLGGYAGVMAANTLLAGGTFVALFLAARRSGRVSLAMGLAAVAAVALVMAPRLQWRPEMALFLTSAVGLWAMESYRRSARAWVLWLTCPVASGFLALMHPSLLFLWAIFGAVGMGLCAEALLARDKPLFRRRLRDLSLAGGLSVVMALLNPLGLDQIIEPLRFVQHSQMLATNHEFRPTFQTDAWPLLIACLGAAAWVFVRGGTRLLRSHGGYLVLVVLFGVLAVQYVRNIALLALVLAIPLARVLSQVAGDDRSRRVGLLGWLATAALLLLMALAPLLQGRLGVGPWPGRFPTALADRLAAAPREPLFNSYGLGGYLAWRLYPGQPVFIDGRHYEITDSLETYSRIVFAPDPGLALAELDRLGIKRIVLSTVLPTGTVLPVLEPLASAPEWGLVDQQGAVVVFDRGTPPLPDARTRLAAALRYGEAVASTGAATEDAAAPAPAAAD